MITGFVGFIGHVISLDSGKVPEFVEQHVVVSREQSHAVKTAYQVLHDGVGNGVPVERRRASTKLVENRERPARCKLEDILSLFHFNVESTLALEDSI